MKIEDNPDSVYKNLQCASSTLKTLLERTKHNMMNIVFVASLPMTYVLESTSYSCNILNSISVQFNSPIKARGLSLI